MMREQASSELKAVEIWFMSKCKKYHRLIEWRRDAVDDCIKKGGCSVGWSAPRFHS